MACYKERALCYNFHNFWRLAEVHRFLLYSFRPLAVVFGFSGRSYEFVLRRNPAKRFSVSVRATHLVSCPRNTSALQCHSDHRRINRYCTAGPTTWPVAVISLHRRCLSRRTCRVLEFLAFLWWLNLVLNFFGLLTPLIATIEAVLGGCGYRRGSTHRYPGMRYSHGGRLRNHCAKRDNQRQ